MSKEIKSKFNIPINYGPRICIFYGCKVFLTNFTFVPRAVILMACLLNGVQALVRKCCDSETMSAVRGTANETPGDLAWPQRTILSNHRANKVVAKSNRKFPLQTAAPNSTHLPFKITCDIIFISKHYYTYRQAIG